MKENLSAGKPAYEEFLGYLRSALHYLYDPVHLRRSPFVKLLGLSEEFDRAAALQRQLTEAIQDFKPAADEPPQSAAWRVYDTLSLLYIRQFSRSTVATQLGISERQLRREQRLALEALAQRLWANVDSSIQPTLPAKSSAEQPGNIFTDLSVQNSPAGSKNPILNQELGWLHNQELEQRVPLGVVLQTVYELAQPLAQQMNVAFASNIQPVVADIPVNGLAVRNILLTLLSAILPQGKAGQVMLSADDQDPNILLMITCTGGEIDSKGLAGANYNEMVTAQSLASFYGAELSEQDTEQGFAVSLTFEAPEKIPVLVIDDNADWHNMLMRYAAGSRFRVVGTRQPETAYSLAERIQPAVIFLDVMMPNLDGWQILSELRHGQATGQIPIVVCTVLPLEDLALSLGVNAFLQKPVTQDQFLMMVEKMSGATNGEHKPSLV